MLREQQLLPYLHWGMWGKHCGPHAREELHHPSRLPCHPHGCLHPALWGSVTTQGPFISHDTQSSIPSHIPSTSHGERKYNPQKRDGVRMSHCCAVSVGGDRPQQPSPFVTGNIKTFPAFFSQVLVALSCWGLWKHPLPCLFCPFAIQHPAAWETGSLSLT